MIFQRETLIAALLVGAAALAATPSTSRAQISSLVGKITGGATQIIPPMPAGPGFAVSDAATEANTFDIATSLITTTPGGWYNPPTSLLGNIQTLFSAINSQTATQLMPVTQGLPCDSYTPMTTEIAPALAQTYNAAISETQQLTTELQGEDFSGIAANVQAPAELAATQANGQALVAILQELRLMRAQLAALTIVVATDKLHELDANVRPLMPRQGSGC